MKKFLCILLIIILSVSVASCAADEGEPQPTPAVYATVDGEDITREEVEYFSERERANILSEYAQRYGINDFSDFWETEFDGKTPSDELFDRALERAITAKLELIVMREKAIYDDISFEGLKQKAIRYNDENKDKSNTVGLKSISLNQFYTYYLDNGRLEIKRNMSDYDSVLSEKQKNAAVILKQIAASKGS